MVVYPWGDMCKCTLIGVDMGKYGQLGLFMVHFGAKKPPRGVFDTPRWLFGGPAPFWKRPLVLRPLWMAEMDSPASN